VAVVGLLVVCRLRAMRSCGSGSVLVEVLVLAGESVTSVAAQVGVSRQTVHTWLGRYRAEGRVA